LTKKKIKKIISSYFPKLERHRFKIKERKHGYPYLKKKFRERTGYNLDLDNPSSFNHKINWKKIYDRNSLLPLTSDKYKVRGFVKEVLGDEEANNILVPLHYCTAKPESIPFDELPKEYIIKTNHGSGSNIIVEKNKPIDKEQIILKCKEWLNNPYGFFKHEWAYQKIKRKLVIEELLRDQSGEIPKDYKFYVFHGKCHLVHIDFDRFGNRSRSLFEPKKWELLPVSLKFKKGGFCEKPCNYKYMIELAEKLGAFFDFVRVDLYSTNERVYFGELSHYPGSGMEEFDPQSFDFELGSKWQLSSNYSKQKR